MAKFKLHLFVCVNSRDDDDARGCCSARGSAAIVRDFKRKLYERGHKRVVRANKCQCLDQCAFGPVMVVYPEGVWYGRLTPDDVDEIIEKHIEGGQVVERLVIPDEHLTGVDKG
jgi:(2Fe-2S) ferredoxin